MAVPSPDEFSAFLTLADAPIEVSATLPETISEQDAVDYLIALDRGRQQRTAELYDMPAFVWLRSQREFQRSRRLVYRPSRRAVRSRKITDTPQPPTIETRILARAREMLKEEQDSPSGLRWRLEIRRNQPFRFNWDVHCVRALAEYYEGGGRELPELARMVEQSHRAACDAVRRYRELAEQLGTFDIHGVRVPRLTREYLPRTLPTPDLSGLPFRRREHHACERLFVYRMRRANSLVSTRRLARPDAIAALMNIEGFRHQYDTRTIERLCAEFRRLEWQVWAKNPLFLAGAN